MPGERYIEVNGCHCRILEAGSGPDLVYLPGFMGMPRWIPLLDLLAERHTVHAPSLPGFPGGTGHDRLDTLSDWTCATMDLLEACGAGPLDVLASSVSAPLALECAAANSSLIRRLALISPFGTFDADDPSTDVWAQRPGPDTYADLLCEDPDGFRALWAKPDAEDPTEWQIIQVRAREAAARYLWPMGNTGILRRAYRVRQPTLILRGEHDKVIPASYPAKFADAIAGDVLVQSLAGAGHAAELDQPSAVAASLAQFLT